MHDTHPYTVFSGAGENPARGGRRLVASVLLVTALFAFAPRLAVLADELADRPALTSQVRR